ncbi:MAG TPA: 2-isopropylmalate synthase [Candidatus Thermoplasmatota archaeon]|nr:2-isopropylmalate synthase [Candidatus Thermoplasmatota archaeon]
MSPSESRDELLSRIKRESLDLPDYQIVDVPEPQLYHDIFPFSEAPRIPLDGIVFPTDVPRDIWITDTTFRDGQQSREPYTVEQMVKLYEMEKRLGGPNNKISMSEFFVYTERDIQAVSRCLEAGKGSPQVTAWIRATKNDVKLFKETADRIRRETGHELTETGMLTSISDYHIFYKFGTGSARSKVVAEYLELAEEVLKAGFTLRCHFEDSTRADTFGVTVPFARKLMRLSEKYGQRVVIRYPDTLGVGVPWVEAALPRSIPKLTWVLRHMAGVPADCLEFHGQQDFQLGIPNATAAWMYGAARNNCTLLGIGERAGNVPLEIMVFMYAGLKGGFDGMDSRVITEIADYYQKELGFAIPPYWPIAGKNFNVTRAGIHADGILKNIEMYLPFDTEKLLNRPPGVGITSYSGAAGIAFWINYYFGLHGPEKVGKDHPGIKRIVDETNKLWESGRTTALSDEEMAAYVARHAPDVYGKYKDRIRR